MTRIELQAVGGAVLAAVGLFYDDYTPASTSPLTPNLLSVAGFNAGITANDTLFKSAFPYVQNPWRGTTAQTTLTSQRGASGLGLAPSLAVVQAYPNPFTDRTTFRFDLGTSATLSLAISDVLGRKVTMVAKPRSFSAGVHEIKWEADRSLAPGQYIATLYSGSTVVQSVRIERQ